MPALLPSLLLATSLLGGDEPPPIPALIISGANNHDWKWTTPSLRSILEESGRFVVDITEKPAATLADAAAIAKYRVFVLDYNGPRWGEPAESNFLAAVEGGTGVSIIHAANNAFPGWEPYECMVADLWREGTGHGRFHRFDVKIVDRDHPITRDLPTLLSHPDELYHRLVHMHDAPRRILATAYSDPATGGTGNDEPMVMVKEYGKGRIFHTPLGHVWTGQEATRASHLDPQFRRLMVRGTEWAATGEVTPEPVNRLTRTEEAQGWQLLFDGVSGAGWRGYRKAAFPEKGWVVEDGALHVQEGGGGGDLVLEWKVAPGANSGIMYLVNESDEYPWRTGPEYQVLDDERHPDGRNPLTSAGSLYALYAPEDPVLRPVGEYNEARIRIQGGRVQHYLNGFKVVDCQLGSDDWNARVEASKFQDMPGFGRSVEGHLCLQDHGDDVWYRNIRVRVLAP